MPKKTRKYILFFEDLTDPQGYAKFIQGVKYRITEESSTSYILGEQNGYSVGVDKSLEGKKYKIGEIRTDG